MLGRLYENQDCSAARTLELIGERWSILILRDAAFRGSTRFRDFERVLGIAPNILAKRLEGFVTSGIMEQRTPGTGADQREYHLTEKGRELKPIVMALSAWGAKWVREGRMIYIHNGCSHDGMAEMQIRCTSCDAVLSSDDVAVAPRLG